jgi:GDP-L-fucose synthase
VHPTAKLHFDTSKPDGTPRKVLDVTRLNDLGWSPSYDLDRGIRSTYEWFIEQQSRQSTLRGMSPA